LSPVFFVKPTRPKNAAISQNSVCFHGANGWS